VTIPSQQRYVNYYGLICKNNLQTTDRTLFLKKIMLHTIPRVANNTCAPFFVIRKGEHKLFQSPVAEVSFFLFLLNVPF